MAGRWLIVCIALLMALLRPGPAGAEPPVMDGLEPPRSLVEVEIEYPPELAATAAPPGGIVVIKFTVGTDGVPHSLSVEQAVHPELDALAADAVSRLRYAPATLHGRPVEVILRLAIELVPPAPVPEPLPEPEPEATPDPLVEAATPPPDEGPVRLRGTVLEAGQRTPVSGASILVVPAAEDAPLGEVRKKTYEAPTPPAWTLSAVSGPDGRFELPGLVDGRLRLVILAPGYERFESVESLAAGQELEVRYFVERLPDNPFRTVVRSKQARREEVTRRTITVEEIRNLPGTQGDALKAVQNFPGIARAPFGIGLLVIRGSDPTDSSVYLGEHEIPQLFHFGGLTSVFNSDVIDQIDFIPGNFDARYGDAVGGVIDVSVRPGRRDGYHGYIDSDLFDTGVLVEGPVGKGSFVLSGRRSYIDLLLPAVLPDDAGLSLTVAPRYYDYQALLDYPVSRGNLSVKVFGSDDRTTLVASDPNDVQTDDRNRFETTLFFHRADLLYENHRDGWDFLVTPSYKYDSFQGGAGDIFRFALATQTFSFRAEMGRQLSRRLRFDVGTQLFAGTFSIDATSPPVPADASGSIGGLVQSSSTDDSFAIPGLHATLTWKPTGSFTVVPGVRLNYYAVLFNRATVDPRMRFAWQIADKTALRGGVGLYSQIPDPPEWNRTWGNPAVAPEKAVHVSASVAHEFPHAITLEVSGFYKYKWDDSTQSTELIVRHNGQVGPEAFATQGSGRVYGAELFLRKELTRNVFGWVSYTISRSERRDAPRAAYTLFDLDQPHILTLIGVYRLPKNWQVGARFRVVSGNPYTPVRGAVFDAGSAGSLTSGSYIPLEGEENSARVATFHQLDLRVDKRFVWKRLMLNLYLDVQNVYNHQNAEFIQYAYDYSTLQPIASLPIIPSLGLKLEF